MVISSKVMLKKIPVLLAVLFSMLDLLYVVFLNFFTCSKSYHALARIWNDIHAPVRFFADPMIFPVITTHPLSITLLDVLLYDGICILQSTVIGYVIGLLIQKQNSKLKI